MMLAGCFMTAYNNATLYRLSASRQSGELLEALFPDGPEQLPRLSKPGDQAYTLSALALAYDTSGQPGRAAPLYRRQIAIREKEGNVNSVSIGLRNLSNALRQAGGLREAEAAARRALVITREQENRFGEAISLCVLGLALAARGVAGRPSPRCGGRCACLSRNRTHKRKA